MRWRRLIRPTIETQADEAGLRALVEAVARRDQAALRQLYDKTSPRMYAAALRVTRDPDLAQDALQEAFLQVWRKANTFRDRGGSVGAWMIAIVRYRAIDLLRSRGADPASDRPGPEPDPVPHPDADVFAAVSANEDGRRIMACLDELRPFVRRCIQLAYYDGCSHAEVARRMEAPLGSVKSSIRRGLLVLRDCLSRGA